MEMRRSVYPPPVSVRLDWNLYEYLRSVASDGTPSEYLRGLVATDCIERSQMKNPEGNKFMRLISILTARLKVALKSGEKGIPMRFKLRVIEPLGELLQLVFRAGGKT